MFHTPHDSPTGRSRRRQGVLPKLLALLNGRARTPLRAAGGRPRPTHFGHLWVLAARTECTPYQQSRLGNTPGSRRILSLAKKAPTAVGGYWSMERPG